MTQPAPTLAPPSRRSLLIVGGGPAGLALACACADAGLLPTIIEAQDEAALVAPAPDGRDIALTHRARQVMRNLGLWQRLPGSDISPLRRAEVHNGTAPSRAATGLLGFDAAASGHEALGFLVPNHALRRAAYEGARARDAVRCITGRRVTAVQAGLDVARVTLDDGQQLAAPLIVAADSRFSTTRRMLGVAARSLDFGRTVIVTRLTTERASDGIAHECFGWRSTLALLPLRGHAVSAVVTVNSSEAAGLLALDDAAFAAHVQREAGNRLGAMSPAGPRHAYPLVAVYAERFAGHRFALLGDAAVGMHPVTAHGYNFGLYGVEVLAALLGDAADSGQNIGDATLLARYAREHRRITWPVYHGTNALVRLYTDDRPPVRLLREAVLRVAEHLPPLKAAITRQLTGMPGSEVTWRQPPARHPA